MLQLAVVEQHDRGRERISDLLIGWPRPAPDRLAFEIAIEEFGDVADREHVRVGHDRQALVPEKARDCEADRSEGLQIIRIPRPHVPASEQRMPLLLKLGKFVRIHDAHVKCAGRAAVAAEAVRRDERAQHLLVVGVNDNSRLHDLPYLGGE